jgi:hypothetical protein
MKWPPHDFRGVNGYALSVTTARIYEAVRVQWIPNPKPLSKGALKLRQLDPARAAVGVPRGPRGEITSVLGNRL